MKVNDRFIFYNLSIVNIWNKFHQIINESTMWGNPKCLTLPAPVKATVYLPNGNLGWAQDIAYLCWQSKSVLQEKRQGKERTPTSPNLAIICTLHDPGGSSQESESKHSKNQDPRGGEDGHSAIGGSVSERGQCLVTVPCGGHLLFATGGPDSCMSCSRKKWIRQS